ncbi:hypothetical protein HK101_009758 [Irineochytrium annulatum]|nr:hypothetical protein HK101_009758 [Irineochytrium annulatum]
MSAAAAAAAAALCFFLHLVGVTVAQDPSVASSDLVAQLLGLPPCALTCAEQVNGGNLPDFASLGDLCQTLTPEMKSSILSCVSTSCPSNSATITTTINGPVTSDCDTIVAAEGDDAGGSSLPETVAATTTTILIKELASTVTSVVHPTTLAHTTVGGGRGPVTTVSSAMSGHVGCWMASAWMVAVVANIGVALGVGNDYVA